MPCGLTKPGSPLLHSSLPRERLLSATLGTPPRGDPQVRLRRLGDAHRRATGMAVNWAGTYEHTAHQMLRRWAMETQWKR
jgi:hypothetical protein